VPPLSLNAFALKQCQYSEECSRWIAESYNKTVISELFYTKAVLPVRHLEQPFFL
jgi:hypothetical protein